MTATTANGLAADLAGPGLTLVTGPFRSRIRARLATVAAGLASLYPPDAFEPATGFADFHVALDRPVGARRWYRPQVRFRFDGREVFRPLPRPQAYPMLEWGLNWCVTTQINHYLLFHAAVLARAGRALILPGEPGVGKSTLCAALASRGWELLSDEIALVALDTGHLHGLGRPVSLKNAAIDVIRRFAPDAVIGATCHDTLKGTVAHLRAPRRGALQAADAACPTWLVFPRFIPGAPTRLQTETRERGFFRLVDNAFNFTTLGTLAFERTTDLVNRSTCLDLTYSDLEEAVGRLGSLRAVD